MEIGTSPLTDIIYAGNTRKLKSGITVWTKKADVTDQAIKAVFEHMYNKARETGNYKLSIEGFGELTLTRAKG